MDAIVELVTNSDDSYRRMGRTEGGRIVIHISRGTGGVLRELAVVDSAQGMTREKLMAALTKFEDSSERSQFPGIRGAFGRGLKDTVFAIGQGKIVTRSRAPAELLETRLVWENGEPKFDDDFSPRSTSPLQDNTQWFGTIVTAKPDVGHPNEISVPEPRTIAQRLPRQYALRDIVRRHRVMLSWKRVATRSGMTKQSKELNRLAPIELPGECVLKQVLNLPTFGEVVLTVYECEAPLEGTAGDPWCLYGFTVTSEGVPLDHRVFLDSRSAAPYFWGTIEIPEIARRLSFEEGPSRYSLLSDDRSGLPWNRKPCREELSPAIRQVLTPLFEQKEKKLRDSAGNTVEPLPDERKWLNFLNSRMSTWFGQRGSVIAEPPASPVGGKDPPPDPPTSPTKLLLAPAVAYVPAGGQRSFSVYVPRGVEGTVQIQAIPGERAVVDPGALAIEQNVEPPSPSGSFTVRVAAYAENGQRIVIHARLDSEEAYAEIFVHEESSRPPGENPRQPPRGATFTGIEFDPQPRPAWRVRYDLETGKIVIYTGYPTVSEILGSGKRRLSSPQSRVLLSELIAEAVCRAAVLRDKDLPRVVEFPRAVEEFDRRRSICLKDIYEFAKAYQA